MIGCFKKKPSQDVLDRIAKLEEQSETIVTQVNHLTEAAGALNKLVQQLSLAQLQLTSDMNIIYESLKEIANVSSGGTDMGFGNVWYVDDDDDLPN